MIVIGTHTVMDGFVIRWYSNEATAERGNEMISASRKGVMSGKGVMITPALFDTAWTAHKRMERAIRATKEDFSDMLTHDRAFGGEITPLVSGNKED